MSSAPGFAFLGAGLFAKEAHLPALSRLKDNAPALKAIYSRSASSAEGLAILAKQALELSDGPAVYYDGNESTNLDALLKRDDVKAVVIVMPITLQPSIILKALEAGKHVLSEKPVAPDVEQGLRLIEKYNTLYKPKGLIWRVAENYEAEPAIRTAGDAIRSGKIGDVIFFKAVAINYVDETNKYYQTPWRTIPDYQGGFLLDGGVHTIAVLRTILPKPLTHLSAFASVNKEYLKPHDTINVIAKSESGKFHGIIEMTWAFPTPNKPQADQFVVTGTRGWLSIDGSSSQNFRVTIRSTKATKEGKEEEVVEVIEEEKKGVEAELKDFFNTITSGQQTLSLGDPAGALQDVAVIQAALNSGGQLLDLSKL